VTSGRQRIAQQPPRQDTDYARFPLRTLKAGDRWYRQHHADHDPWWFSSNGAGRFDLDSPNGTCYLADNPAATVRERVGPKIADHGAVAASTLAGRLISALPLPSDQRSANLDAGRAADQYGVTGELVTMTPYAIPQAWARALHQAGFDAIKGRLRFAVGRTRGLALFGPAGNRPGWPVDHSAVDALTVARQLPMRVLDPPDNEQLTVVPPPH
jgi:hypothetical protein